MKIIVLLILFAVSFSGFAQDISGTVISADEGKAIPYCSVRIKNTNQGLQCDSTGKFILNDENVGDSDTLVFSYLAYSTKEIAVIDYLANYKGRVILVPRTYEISGVDINDLSLKSLVSKCIAKIKKSLPASPDTAIAYYRQYHRENGKYVFLTDAQLAILFPSKLKHQEQVAILEQRRSDNYEQNGEEHGDHLIDLLNANPIYHLTGTVLNSKAISYYTFAIDTTNKDPRYTGILFYLKTDPKKRIESGRLLVDPKDFRLISYQCDQTKNPEQATELFTGNNRPFTWEMLYSDLNAAYTWKNGMIYLTSLSKSYSHNLINNIFGNNDYLVNEYFLLKVYYPSAIDTKINYKFSLNAGLYHSKYNYHPEFWKNDFYAQELPINAEFTAGLEKKKTLEIQFLENGK